MIPYDDLVIALQTWRARQGLPVAQLSGVAISPPPVQAAAPDFDSPRPGPPSAPPRAVPPPLAPVDTRDDEVEEAALIEEEAQYENEGDDFAMAFGGQPPPEAEAADESTSIGTAPPPGRDSFGGSTEPEPPPGKLNQNDDW
jgi:hypothetical protein